MSVIVERGVFEGLRSYEIVLLVMGVLFFLVLIFLLINSVVKRKNYWKLLPFFLFPIVMAGFPSVKQITFEADVKETEKMAKEVESNPGNAEIKKELALRLKSFEGRRITNPDTLKVLEKAYTAAGDSQKANIYRGKLLSVKKTTPP